ncbi:MAG: glycosyltransferase [Chitinophagaceae bacterium]|nr:glycosyltransferase [Chitinophagaceae bacterium]
MAIDYSIVVCTYNPEEGILKRCLESIYRLDLTGISTEVIIVDNNSSFPVAELPYVKEYLRKIPAVKILLEKEQGEKFARMAAIEQSTGRYIVYFDSDNEAYPDYLQQLQKLNTQFPEVAAWGPGNVWVDFIDGVEAGIEEYAPGAFQERHEKEVRFGQEREWQSYYPFGTGLCTLGVLLKEYVMLAKRGDFTPPGRKGNRLSSGADTQMVLLCIKKGYAAGVAPELKIIHIIPGSRANTRYLLRLVYGTFVAYKTCLIQVFPEKKNEVKKEKMPGWKFSVSVVKKYYKAKKRNNKHRWFELVQFIATEAGVYKALGKPVPLLVNKIIQRLQVV